MMLVPMEEQAQDPNDCFSRIFTTEDLDGILSLKTYMKGGGAFTCPLHNRLTQKRF